jgi:hypothetical protein
MANVAAQVENSKGATSEETVWTNDDRSRDRRLAARHRRQLKKRTQGNGGSRQNLAAARERLTRRAIPAPRKGLGRQGSGKDDVRGVPKRRTFVKWRRAKPRRNSGIRGGGVKQQLRLGSKGNINEIFKENLGLEITNRMAGTSFMIRKTSVKTLRWGRPTPERKKRRQKHSPRNRTNRGTPIGYSGRIAWRREQCAV